jgi:hypothetical protein
MISQESASSGPSTAVPGGTAVPGTAAVAGSASSGAVLRTDLLHRHLSARVAAARETLDILEARTPAADDQLVHWFAARVAEAHQVLDQERTETRHLADERLDAARRQAATIVLGAEGEARVLRDVAMRLSEAPVGGTGRTGATELADDEVTVDVRDDVLRIEPVLDLGGSDAAVPAGPAAPAAP